jgi:ABC-type uncharacterized transport system substrate-binding protein
VISMTNKRASSAHAALLVLTTILLLFPPSRSLALSRRVFVLHSYEQGHVCGQPQYDGVMAALTRAGFKDGAGLDVQTYYMDTKRKNNTPALIERQARIALEKIRVFHPDILATIDDNAFRTVALKLVDSSISIVFSGMNGQPEDYNRKRRFMESREHPGHNITGVYEKLHFVDAVRVHSRLFPGLKKILVLEDLSPTGKAIAKQIRLELAEGSIPCALETKTVRTWEGFCKEILSANRRPEIGAIYMAALLLKDRKGRTYTAPEIFRWEVRNGRKPEIAINYEFTRMGLFGGAAVDFYAMGQQAGRMVIKILQGALAGSIPIEEDRRYALVFNLKRAQQLGIEIPTDVVMAADEVITGN